jgi:hypothetical protein
LTILLPLPVDVLAESFVAGSLPTSGFITFLLSAAALGVAVLISFFIMILIFFN